MPKLYFITHVFYKFFILIKLIFRHKLQTVVFSDRAGFYIAVAYQMAVLRNAITKGFLKKESVQVCLDYYVGLNPYHSSLNYSPRMTKLYYWFQMRRCYAYFSGVLVFCNSCLWFPSNIGCSPHDIRDIPTTSLAYLSIVQKAFIQYNLCLKKNELFLKQCIVMSVLNFDQM